MKDWWKDLAKKTQMYADLEDKRLFYAALKAVYKPSHQIQAPLRSSDGSTLLIDKDTIMHRWFQHFSSLFIKQTPSGRVLLTKVPPARK